jgi:hypothetical protein
MAIQRLGNLLVGTLAERTALSTTNLLAETKFYETDTERTARWTGSIWNFPIPFVSASEGSFTVYIAGTTVKARNNMTGLIAASGDNTVDAVPTIEYAINNIPGAAADGWGGKVHLMRGLYKCITQLDLDIANTTYHGVELTGEGKGTRLRFIPASGSPIVDGIKIKMSRPRIANLVIYGNDYVTNLIHDVGSGSVRHDFGIIENVQFDGVGFTHTQPEWNTVPSTVTNQVGLLHDGSVVANFFWTLNNCWFRGLHMGVNCYDQYATSTSQNGNVFLNCEYGERLSGSQHNLSNFWIQGITTVGKYGLWFKPEGVVGNSGLGEGAVAGITNIINIQAELHKTAEECAAVLIEKGTSGTPGSTKTPANIRMVNVRNSYSDPQYWFSVIDKTDNTRGNFDFERGYIRKITALKQRLGSFAPGHHAVVAGVPQADGILHGNVVELTAVGSGSYAFINLGEGLARQLSTGATANSIVGYRATNASGGRYNRQANPKLIVRFMLQSNAITNNGRIFVGQWGDFADPTISPSNDLLNGKNGFGLWCDMGVSTDWKVMHNDGTGSATVNPLSTVSQIAGLVMYIVEVRIDDAAAKAFVTLNSVQTTISTDLPASGTALGWLIYWDNIAAAQRQLWVHDVELETIR